MKHLLRILTISVFMAIGTSAFSQVDILAGLGFSFGTAAETVGLHFRGDVDITEEWGGSLNITTYFSSEIKYWEINFDGRYILYNRDPWTIYPLAGLNISTVGVKGLSGLGILGVSGVSATKIGLNIGGGARYAIAPNISLLGEIKYIISSFDQLVITAGGLYHF